VDGVKQSATAPFIKDIHEYYWIYEAGVDKIHALGHTGTQYVYFKIREGISGKGMSITFVMSASLDELLKHGMSESTYKKYLHDTM
jgi:hypothetical protein